MIDNSRQHFDQVVRSRPVEDLEMSSELDSFQKDGAGLLLPKPKLEEVRQLVFRGAPPLQVRETIDEIKDAVGHARESGAHWVDLHDPTYNESLVIPTKSFDDLVFIHLAWVPVEALERQRTERAMAMRGIASAQMAPGSVPLQLSRAVRRRK